MAFESTESLAPAVSEALSSPTERSLALEIGALLPVHERKQLLGPLLSLASFSHGQIDTVRELILSLPLDWLKTNIRTFAQPILLDGGDEEYRRVLELYRQLDPGLMADLARRAALSDDPDIAEVGAEFMAGMDIRPSGDTPSE